MGKILWIIVLIIVIIALYNVFTKFGSEIRFDNFSGFFRIPSGLNHGTSSNFMFLPVGGNSGAAIPGNQSSPPSSQQPARPAIVPPAGFAVGQLSPFYGQVKLGSVSPGNFYNPGQFSIRTDGSLRNPVNITGWHLKSNKGDIVIPTGISDYGPSGSSPSTDIFLKQGDYVNFSNNMSPISRNFRLNECMGFLNNLYQFNPSLPSNCPTMYNRSELISFSGLCQSTVFSIGNCSVPTTVQMNNLSASYQDRACTSFITDRFSYSGCYANHRGDKNFFSNEWRAWMYASMRFDPDHDYLLLFDQSNLLVDQYSY